MTKKNAGLILSLILISACAYTPHEVQVTAHAPILESNIGQSVSLGLQVFDDRDSAVIGQRGVGMTGADITAEDVVQVLENELTEVLEAKSFKVLSSESENDAEVEVRLRAFKFFIESGFFTGAENTSVVVIIEAEKGGQDFDRTYRYSSENSTIIILGAELIDTKLNAALSNVLRQIANDSELMKFLGIIYLTGRWS